MTYDAYNMLIEAIERAGSTDPDAIRDALSATEGFDGTGGTITIDDGNNAIRPAVAVKVVDGEFTYEATINP